MSVCTTENTTLSRSSIRNTFQNVVEKRNPFECKIDPDALNRRRLRFCLRRTMLYVYEGHNIKCSTMEPNLCQVSN